MAARTKAYLTSRNTTAGVGDFRQLAKIRHEMAVSLVFLRAAGGRDLETNE